MGVAARISHKGQLINLGNYPDQQTASAAIRAYRETLTEICPCGKEFKLTFRWMPFCHKHSLWASQLRHRLGADNDILAALLRLKEEGCSICGSHHLLSVDHCHATGEIRGWLCRKCNSALGFFNDDPERIRAALRYLGG